MATWVRNGTGTAPSATDANLTGNVSLDNGTAPADFDAAAVSQVRIQWRLTVAGIADDTWTDWGDAQLTNGTQQAALVTTGGFNTRSTNGSWDYDLTDTSIPTTITQAQWEAMYVTSENADWATFNTNKMADGSTASIPVANVVVTITYTPASTDRQARVSFAEMEVPNAPRQARVSFAELEVPSGPIDAIRGWETAVETVGNTSITINKPTGTVENDIMYAFIVHETSGATLGETPPSGWNDFAGTMPINLGAGQSAILIYKKVATASEGASYTFVTDTSNQMAGIIVTIKNTYTEDVSVFGQDTTTPTSVTLNSISTSATGLIGFAGTESAGAGSNPYWASTSGMDKHDDTYPTYTGATLGFFSQVLSSVTSTTETFTTSDSGFDIGALLISFVPATPDREAQVSFAELEVPNAPRQARVSFAELEVPTAPRRAQVSFTEFEIPTAPREAQVSFAELEVPDAPREAQVSFAEFEVPDAPRQARVSFAEFEIPNADRKAQVSFTEFEVPNAPTADRLAQVSFAELEIPDGAREAWVSFAELEVPDAPRRVQVSFAEMETPDGPRRVQVAFAEFEVPTAPRRTQVSFAELEVPDAPRRAQVAFAEVEVPTAPRRAQVSFAELETPQFARKAQVSFAEFEVPSPTGVYTRTRGLSKFIWKS